MKSPKQRRKLYDRECCGKLRHEHMLSALIHINNLRINGETKNLGIYVCEFCTGVHVGQAKQWKALTELHEV